METDHACMLLHQEVQKMFSDDLNPNEMGQWSALKRAILSQ